MHIWVLLCKNIHKIIQFLREFQFHFQSSIHHPSFFKTCVNYINYSIQKGYFEIDLNISSHNRRDTTCLDYYLNGAKHIKATWAKDKFMSILLLCFIRTNLSLITNSPGTFANAKRHVAVPPLLSAEREYFAALLWGLQNRGLEGGNAKRCIKSYGYF